MITYYLLNQNQSGIKSQFVFNKDYEPQFLLTGRFSFGQGTLNLLTITGDYLGRISLTKNNFVQVYQLELDHEPIGQIRKLTGVWHQFAYVSNLNWTVMGTIGSNTYQTTHGLRTIFNAEPTLFRKKLDGLQLTIQNETDILPSLLVAATLNQWSLNNQTKVNFRFNRLTNFVPD